jgi:lipopolysaccharide/colanic/teichoic acid biosynthesis glycosyltransferase
MTVMEDGDGLSQAKRGDERVTRVGAGCAGPASTNYRSSGTCCAGEMSVVGPRPHAVAHDNYYDTLIENYAARHHVKPGLTGWAQVNGHRGETPEVAMMAARVDHDVWYVNN